jgi:hypothetical protein
MQGLHHLFELGDGILQGVVIRGANHATEL